MYNTSYDYGLKDDLDQFYANHSSQNPLSGYTGPDQGPDYHLHKGRTNYKERVVPKRLYLPILPRNHTVQHLQKFTTPYDNIPIEPYQFEYGILISKLLNNCNLHLEELKFSDTRAECTVRKDNNLLQTIVIQRNPNGPEYYTTQFYVPPENDNPEVKRSEISPGRKYFNQDVNSNPVRSFSSVPKTNNYQKHRQYSYDKGEPQNPRRMDNNVLLYEETRQYKTGDDVTIERFQRFKIRPNTQKNFEKVHKNKQLISIGSKGTYVSPETLRKLVCTDKVVSTTNGQVDNKPKVGLQLPVQEEKLMFPNAKLSNLKNVHYSYPNRDNKILLQKDNNPNNFGDVRQSLKMIDKGQEETITFHNLRSFTKPIKFNKPEVTNNSSNSTYPYFISCEGKFNDSVLKTSQVKIPELLKKGSHSTFNFDQTENINPTQCQYCAGLSNKNGGQVNFSKDNVFRNVTAKELGIESTNERKIEQGQAGKHLANEIKSENEQNNFKSDIIKLARRRKTFRMVRQRKQVKEFYNNVTNMHGISPCGTVKSKSKVINEEGVVITKIKDSSHTFNEPSGPPDSIKRLTTQRNVDISLLEEQKSFQINRSPSRKCEAPGSAHNYGTKLVEPSDISEDSSSGKYSTPENHSLISDDIDSLKYSKTNIESQEEISAANSNEKTKLETILGQPSNTQKLQLLKLSDNIGKISPTNNEDKFLTQKITSSVITKSADFSLRNPNPEENYENLIETTKTSKFPYGESTVGSSGSSHNNDDYPSQHTDENSVLSGEFNQTIIQNNNIKSTKMKNESSDDDKCIIM